MKRRTDAPQLLSSIPAKKIRIVGGFIDFSVINHHVTPCATAVDRIAPYNVRLEQILAEEAVEKSQCTDCSITSDSNETDQRRF